MVEMNTDFGSIEISGALVNGTEELQMPLPQSISNPSEISQNADTHERVYHYAHIPLMLCTNALQLSNNEQPLDVSHWKPQITELENWHNHRPHEFKPMVKLDSPAEMGVSSAFPAIVFTSGAATFANQLYHIAMMLLLFRRPRTARLTDSRTTISSPLWHARRVCSIAQHNDYRECWDPSLLASFSLLRSI